MFGDERGGAKSWLLEGAAFALAMFLFFVYAGGQWGHTVRFLKDCWAFIFGGP